MISWKDFKNIWIVDYEFNNLENKVLPTPLCYVAYNLRTDKWIQHWISKDEKSPEYSTDKNSLFVSFASDAEMTCHEALSFPLPEYVLDLWVEFKCITNGKLFVGKKTLVNACAYYNVKGADGFLKEAMRELILSKNSFTSKEKLDILNYCKKDVQLTTNLLLSKMKNDINLTFALFRGAYMKAVTKMQIFGIPIDIKKFRKLQDCWGLIKEDLVSRINQHYDVYEGTTFKLDKFKKYLIKHQIPWEITPAGRLKIDNKYFEDQVDYYPQLKPLYELRYTLGQLKLKDLKIGIDNRNRVWLNPFGTKTGRNAPSSAQFIFGPAVWIRHLIAPEEGQALAYIDFEQQELGIASSISNDDELKKAYNSGDPYIKFVKDLGLVPPEATKKSHPNERELAKKLVLAMNYGQGPTGFSIKAKISYSKAKFMINFQKQKYNKFFQWSQHFADTGIIKGQVSTILGWKFDTTFVERANTLLNWPMQSIGANILQLSICLCIQNKIDVCAPIHDAILIQGPIDQIEEITHKAQKCMEAASEQLINFKLRTEAKIIRYPDHYMDPRGELMWNGIWESINNLDQ